MWFILTIAVKIPAVSIQMVRMTYEIGAKTTWTSAGLLAAIKAVDYMIASDLIQLKNLMPTTGLATGHYNNVAVYAHLNSTWNDGDWARNDDGSIHTQIDGQYIYPTLAQCCSYGIIILAHLASASLAIGAITTGVGAFGATIVTGASALNSILSSAGLGSAMLGTLTVTSPFIVTIIYSLGSIFVACNVLEFYKFRRAAHAREEKDKLKRLEYKNQGDRIAIDFR